VEELLKELQLQAQEKGNNYQAFQATNWKVMKTTASNLVLKKEFKKESNEDVYNSK
jgi:hypothetical protein